MRPAWLGLGLLLLAPSAPALAKEPKPKPAPAEALSPLGRKIDEAIRGAGGEKLWGVALVAVKGEVVFAKGYGFADYKAVPNAPDTLFELASVSKHVTAAAILRLEQQKKLKTSDALDKFFPKAPKDKKKVTLDHLLHHTSGLSDSLGVSYAWPGTRDAYAEQMLAPALVGTPGAKFSYSNVGYALLAAVVEVVTGKPFEDYVRKELFGPAGLTETGFIDDAALKKLGRATVRKCDDCEPTWTAVDWWWGWGYRGMGGVVTSARDFVKWDRALRGDKVLGAAAKAKYYTPALDDYACGWKTGRTPRGKPTATHSGGVRGYAIEVTRGLEDDFLVLFFSNGACDLFGVERAIFEAAGL